MADVPGHCTQCGSPVPTGSNRFCTSCGAEIMTTPGFISGDEYTDPGAEINSHFAQSNAQLRELVAKDKERIAKEREEGGFGSGRSRGYRGIGIT